MKEQGVDNRCCGLCRHNPIWEARKPSWFTRLLWWPALQINIFCGRLVFVRKEKPWAGAGPCARNPQLFCYDAQGSRACQYHVGSTRPEFLACKACPAFEMQHGVPGDE